MNSRIVIASLCVAAVAFACGPRARNEAAVTKKNTKTTAVALTKAAPAPRPSRKSQSVDPKNAVAAQFYVHAGETSIRLALHIVNTSRKRVELTFPSGQTYDFVVLDTVGRELWRWGTGKMFTQALRNKLLSGGEFMDLEETWSAVSLAPGRYVARALLTSENFPIVQETEFTVQATTVASR